MHEASDAGHIDKLAAGHKTDDPCGAGNDHLFCPAGIPWGPEMITFSAPQGVPEGQEMITFSAPQGPDPKISQRV